MKEIIERVIQFRNERNWQKHDNLKDHAIAISIEASELLENFQWKSSEEALEKNEEHIKDELADVLMNCFMMAEDLHVDIEEIINRKLDKNAIKYPVEKCYGTSKKYTEL